MGGTVNTAGVLVVAGVIAPLASLITALTMLRVNKNSAVKLLSEAQQIAQKTALESNDAALKNVREQCDRCEARVTRVEMVCMDLVIAAEARMDQDTPENLAAERQAIWAARRAI